MKRMKTMLLGAALVAASSALASAQPKDQNYKGHFEERGRDNDRRDNDRRDNDRRNFERRDYDRHDYGRYDYGRYDYDRHFDRDRDFHASRFADRDGDRDRYQYRVGERRFFNGFYWNWDGSRWCRQSNGISFYLNF
jgi:Ni/Co efflux regulator RcnB